MWLSLKEALSPFATWGNVTDLAQAKKEGWLAAFPLFGAEPSLPTQMTVRPPYISGLPFGSSTAAVRPHPGWSYQCFHRRTANIPVVATNNTKTSTQGSQGQQLLTTPQVNSRAELYVMGSRLALVTI